MNKKDSLEASILLLDRIRHKVGTWSESNFGNNRVNCFDCLAPHVEKDEELVCVPHIEVEINWLAPLMGIGEELGELSKACVEHDAKEIHDALGDTGIYLSDYLYRSGRTYQQIVGHFDSIRKELSDYEPRRANLHSAYGKLLHVHLKRFQRIRGMADDSVFTERRDGAAAMLLFELHHYSMSVHSMNFAFVVDQVWTAVQERNWKKNQQQGIAASK